VRLDVNQPEVDRQRSVTVTLYPSSSDLVEVINRVATGGFDLSPFITNASHTSVTADINMTWDGTGMFLANQPASNDIIEVVEDGEVLWLGFVESVNTYHEERGSRIFQISCVSRDAIGPWRAKRITTPRFTEGTSLTAVAETLITGLGLSPEEYIVPLGGPVVPHENMQFAEVAPWEALTDIGLAIGATPYVDAMSRIKFISRDVDRVSDIVLTNERVLRINGGRGRPPLSEFKLKWLDRNLTEVVQEEQVLGSTSITAGFWKGTQTEKIYWSEDRRGRAKNTKMKVITSINSALLPIGSESYTQVDEFHGEVEVEVSIFVSGLATASLAAVLALDVAPDGVQVGITGTGITIPKGRVVRGVAEASLLLIMMSIGTGQYEILGEPYDFVHQRNTTTAYNDAAPYWAEEIQEESNDLIYDEDHAQSVCIRELLYRLASANRWDVDIVDDWRIEVGDILELSDGSRLYVSDYERDLTRGSGSVLSIYGFRV